MESGGQDEILAPLVLFSIYKCVETPTVVKTQTSGNRYNC